MNIINLLNNEITNIIRHAATYYEDDQENKEPNFL